MLSKFQAIYALIVCARLKNKETVLIHSAGSSIGQAAINVAYYHECRIFVGVSSIDEKLFIKENFPFVSKKCNYQIVLSTNDSMGTYE